MPIHFVGDNDGCFKCASNDTPKKSTEPTMTVHVSALRELLPKQCVCELIWCDNQDMIADPLTKGKTRIHVLNTVLRSREWSEEHEIETRSFKPPPTVALVVQIAQWLTPCAQLLDHRKTSF
eukprot:12181041-Prorocentrum_lima.AAC.1